MFQKSAFNRKSFSSNKVFIVPLSDLESLWRVQVHVAIFCRVKLVEASWENWPPLSSQNQQIVFMQTQIRSQVQKTSLKSIGLYNYITLLAIELSQTEFKLMDIFQCFLLLLSFLSHWRCLDHFSSKSFFAHFICSTSSNYRISVVPWERRHHIVTVSCHVVDVIPHQDPHQDQSTKRLDVKQTMCCCM